MVAKIKSGKSLIGALNYNENKVKAGKAKLIAASGYMKSHEILSFYDKLFRLTDLAGRNQRTRTNTVHLSLNFDVTENLSNELLVKIADEYMEKIGFGHQPYLIYNHFDAGHPHIHLVTTNIEADGKRISLHNIGEIVSDPARKAIEIDFGLVRASNKGTKHDLDENIVIQPIEYGQTDTKRGITNIVNAVAKGYKFTSLPEFNAILSQFNVMADKGKKESVMFKKGGLHYWVIDKNGKKTGVPIKASSIYNTPTLLTAKVCLAKSKRLDIARRTFATTITLTNGVPIETVSKLLGHTKLTTTLIYAKVVESKWLTIWQR